MSEPMKEDRKKSLPWVKIVLMASLGLNLLFVGAIVGARLGEGPRDAARDNGRDQVRFSVGPYGRALSKEDRKALGEAFRERSSDFRANRQQMRSIGAQVVEALRSDPFEPADVAALLEQQIALGKDMQRGGQSLLLDRITAMNPDARLEFADKLESMLKRGKPKRKKQ